MARMAFLKEVETDSKPVQYKTSRSMLLVQIRAGPGLWLSHNSKSILIPELWSALERSSFSLQVAFLATIHVGIRAV